MVASSTFPDRSTLTFTFTVTFPLIVFRAFEGMSGEIWVRIPPGAGVSGAGVTAFGFSTGGTFSTRWSFSTR